MDHNAFVVEHVNNPPTAHAHSETWVVGEFLDVGGLERIAGQLVQLASNAKCLIPWHAEKRFQGFAAELEPPHLRMLTCG